jgi:hypothetical protein
VEGIGRSSVKNKSLRVLYTLLMLKLFHLRDTNLNFFSNFAQCSRGAQEPIFRLCVCGPAGGLPGLASRILMVLKRVPQQWLVMKDSSQIHSLQSEFQNSPEKENNQE